jgi:hypothetical protein
MATTTAVCLPRRGILIEMHLRGGVRGALVGPLDS